MLFFVGQQERILPGVEPALVSKVTASGQTETKKRGISGLTNLLTATWSEVHPRLSGAQIDRGQILTSSRIVATEQLLEHA